MPSSLINLYCLIARAGELVSTKVMVDRLRLTSFAFHVYLDFSRQRKLIVFDGRSQNSNLRRFCYDGRS